jgi:hypothetical protein
MNDDNDDRDPIGDGSGINLRRLAPNERRSRKPNGRFKQHHSGNPKGRPREIISLHTAFLELMQEQDPAAGNGGPVMSKQEALMRTLFGQAAKGNQRAFARFVILAKRAGYLDLPAPARPPERSGTAVFGDMEKFKAEFGKPLPNLTELKTTRNATNQIPTGE